MVPDTANALPNTLLTEHGTEVTYQCTIGCEISYNTSAVSIHCVHGQWIGEQQDCERKCFHVVCFAETFFYKFDFYMILYGIRGQPWPSGSALGYGPKGRAIDSALGKVLPKIHLVSLSHPSNLYCTQKKFPKTPFISFHFAL